MKYVSKIIYMYYLSISLYKQSPPQSDRNKPTNEKKNVRREGKDYINKREAHLILM